MRQVAVAAVAVVALVSVVVLVVDNGSDQEVVRADVNADADRTKTTSVTADSDLVSTTTSNAATPSPPTTALTGTTFAPSTPSTSAPTTTLPSAPPPDRSASLDVRVTTDRTDYVPDQPVVITVTSCNRRPSVYRENHPLPHYRTRVLNERGERVADDDGVLYPDAMTSTEWQPGECKVQRREWAQNSGPLSPGKVDSRPSGERVPPGSYHVELTWNGYEDRPPDLKPVFSSEPFRIA